MSTRPDLLREAAEPLSGSPSDYDSLLDLVGECLLEGIDLEVGLLVVGRNAGITNFHGA